MPRRSVGPGRPARPGSGARSGRCRRQPSSRRANAGEGTRVATRSRSRRASARYSGRPVRSDSGATTGCGPRSARSRKTRHVGAGASASGGPSFARDGAPRARARRRSARSPSRGAQHLQALHEVRNEARKPGHGLRRRDERGSPVLVEPSHPRGDGCLRDEEPLGCLCRRPAAGGAELEDAETLDRRVGRAPTHRRPRDSSAPLRRRCSEPGFAAAEPGLRRG